LKQWSKLGRAFFKWYASLTQQTGQCAGLDFAVQWDDASAGARLMTAWLPLCRTWVKPSFSKALTICAPERDAAA
jgi:hypothetical protein